MSRYDDPRVCRTDDGYTVTMDGIAYRVMDTEFNCFIVTGPGKRLVGSGFTHAEDAIAYLIGDRRDRGT